MRVTGQSTPSFTPSPDKVSFGAVEADFTMARPRNKIWKRSGEGTCQCRNGYGRADALTLALAMRYVIVICAITFFLIWDGLYNQGRYLDTTVREMSRIVRYVTGKV